MCELVMGLAMPSIETTRSNVSLARSYNMITLPFAGEVVTGTSCEALNVARNSTTWAWATAKQALNAPSNSNPRIGVIFMGGLGNREFAALISGTLQSVTTWKE